ncbi:RNA exonuclease 4 [Entomortierella parvispora]|uniref:RNA exonuclease 4 n=1 Tax=Entomortierella parvispora TaxID=205924 RepID=A0A9P3M265_9FUNG|nr:RNA exonuclease 4 [Entomortierella parvispora]
MPPKQTPKSKNTKGKKAHSVIRLNYSKKPAAVQPQVSKKAKIATVKAELAAKENKVSSSVVAKAAPSSNWKQLQAKIKPAPRKSIPVTKAPKKRAHEEISDDEEQEDDQEDSAPVAKAQKSDIASGTKHDTTDLWFDDISKEDLEKAYGKSGKKTEYDPTATGKHKIGKYVGIDCEMVGVGPDGVQSALARVSIVNYYGVTILDLFVRPMERVTDFRTAVSGITPKHLLTAVEFKDAQKQVADVIEDKIVVGHAVHNDFKALLLDHPQRLIRDTSRYKPFRALSKGNTPSLKRLAHEILGIRIQDGAHSSVEDARITILLYRKHKDAWDASLALKAKKRVQQATKMQKKTAAKK